MKKILSLLRRTVEDYDMISAGDRIAVGCSGGKDSVLLLAALNRLSKFYPKKFTVVAITLDTGVGMDYTPLKEYCEREGIEHIIRKTRISEIVFNDMKQKNPCSLCAKLRRGALNLEAKNAGCNKVALGHHNDDVIETLMLNLIYEGRLGCFQPVTYLSRRDITVIRPLVYIDEKLIKHAVKKYKLPVITNPCPANGHTQREEMKNLITGLDARYAGFRIRLFGALKRSGLNGWRDTGDKTILEDQDDEG